MAHPSHKQFNFCKPQKDGFCASFLITISASGFIDMSPPRLHLFSSILPQ